MNHLPFIAGAYGVTVIVLIGLVLWVVADGRRVTERLKALDAQGVRRRSGQAASSR